MAADNKTLGRFQLTGIPAAPRGVPQIEVTFDIDANGIVNVTAKDLGTGKEQNVVIQSSSNMSKEEIDKAVKEAEQYANEDKAKEEEINTRNNADAAVYNAEKTLKDLGDKVTDTEKAPVEDAIKDLKEKLEGSDTEAIKKATEKLSEALYPIAEKLYADQANQQNAGANAQGASDAGKQDDNVVDADYEVVDDDDK